MVQFLQRNVFNAFHSKKLGIVRSCIRLSSTILIVCIFGSNFLLFFINFFVDHFFNIIDRQFFSLLQLCNYDLLKVVISIDCRTVDRGEWLYTPFIEKTAIVYERIRTFLTYDKWDR